MVDLATLTTGAKAISGLYSSIKALIDVKKDLDVVEKLEQILDLKGTLLDAKEEILSLREEVSALKQEIETKSSLIFDERLGCYFTVEGNRRVGICTKCWTEHKRKAPLKQDDGSYYCPTCTTWYADDAAVSHRAITDYDPLA